VFLHKQGTRNARATPGPTPEARDNIIDVRQGFSFSLFLPVNSSTFMERTSLSQLQYDARGDEINARLMKALVGESAKGQERWHADGDRRVKLDVQLSLSMRCAI
jgi:hypothetical protein